MAQDALENYARELLGTLWGAPKEPSPRFLAVLQSVLDRHEEYVLRTIPDFPPTRPTPVAVPVQDEDDIATIIRWMNEGEWLQQ